MSTVLCDVDGVVADLHVAWYGRYNERYGDNLQPEDVTDWNLHHFVVPECGKAIYDILREEDLYDDVPVTAGAHRGIQEIRAMGHRVVFVTSSNPVSAKSKMIWLKLHGFVPGEPWVFDDVVIAQDKSLVRGDAIIDDGVHNLRSHPALVHVLFSQPYNREYRGAYRAHTWEDVVYFIGRDLGCGALSA